jgi:hypothetical protein
MHVRMLATLVLTLSASTLAFAQVQPPQDRINTALDRARQVGIPLSLLENKIAEGKAKGVAPERLAEAIERRLAALERARAAIGDRPDAADSLSVAADAVESGVSDAALRAIADNAPRDRRNVAIAVLTELVEQGQAPEAALERVRAALARGPEALTNLPAEARGGGRRGGDAPNTRGAGAAGDRPASAGPPAGVPAPGNTPQATRPGGPPSSVPAGGRR